MSSIGQAYERTKEKILGAALNPVQKLLPGRRIEAYCHETKYTWRERELGPVVTLLACVWKHLHPELVSARVTEDYLCSLSSAKDRQVLGERDGSGFCKARLRLPVDVFRWAATQVGQQASRTQAQLCHGLPVYLVDGTTLRTPNTLELETHFGRSRNAARKSRSPLVRLVLWVCASTGAVLQLASGAYATSEQALFLQLLKTLTAPALLVADRGYFSFLFFALVSQHRAELLTRIPSRCFTKRPLRKLGYRDLLYEWKRPPLAQSRFPELLDACPQLLLVRVIEREIVRKGYRTWTLRIATTLTDPQRYPAEELADLYLRRWRVETTFRTLKTYSHLAHLTGKTPATVRKEIYSAVLAHNCVAALMAESGEAPELLSPTRAREILMLYSGHMAFAATVLLPGFYREMLRMIATALQLPQERGPEPRAIVQRPSTFPVLMTSRDVWKHEYKTA
jgi:hypothetical protein